ncbi:MAG: mechanosensitive ion channel [Thermoanaerobaculia bacterium]|nr:mechanosensitive ion channel [Thermoanaerobaculia bacterium]
MIRGWYVLRYPNPSMPENQSEPLVTPEEPPTVSEAFDIFSDKINGWIESFIANLPNLIAALGVLLLFWIIARLSQRGLERGLRRMPIPAPIRNLITSALSLIIIAAGFFIALGLLGLDKTVASLLAGVGIIGLALGFAFQDIAANFMAGIVLSFRRPFSIGDVVETNEVMGVVREINLRTTILHRFTGEVVRIPNKEVLNSAIVNYSSQGRRRVDLAVGIAYGDDLEKARDVTMRAVSEVDARIEDRDVELFYEEFGDSSINFMVRFWVPYVKQTDYLKARSDAIIRIKKAFDENDITIPFPIRTLDFGVVGGEPLAEHLPNLAHRSSS